MARALGGMRWQRRASEHVPESWRTWEGTRQSALSGSNQRASHPVNALLNFAYAASAARVERALTLAGLDGGLGFLHAPDPYRASLAWDVLELLRAGVDSAVVQRVRRGVPAAENGADTNRFGRWPKRAFRQLEDGSVWCRQELLAVVAQTCLPRDRAVQQAVLAVRTMIEARSAPG
jgi:hypothetical protein